MPECPACFFHKKHSKLVWKTLTKTRRANRSFNARLTLFSQPEEKHSGSLKESSLFKHSVMKQILFLALPLLTVIAANCSKSDNLSTSTCDGDTEFILGEPFTLCYGVDAHLIGNDDFIASFHTLYSDSRCPLDSLALCVWQGRADAGFTVSLGQLGASDTLSIGGLGEDPVSDSMSFLSYKVKLLAIEPYPTSVASPVPTEDYKLKLLIEQ